MITSDTEHTALTDIPAQQAGYHAGDAPDASSEIDLGCWHPPLQSANLDILPSKDTIEARTVDVASNDGYIAGSIQYHVDHAVGTGLKLSMRPDWKALGQTEEWGDEYADVIEGAFRDWTEDDRNLVDASGVQNWPALQAVAYRSLLQHGEVLATFEPVRSHDKMITRIRMIDPARLSDPKDSVAEMRNRDIKGGIEYNKRGEPVAYWISNKHPRDLNPRNKRHERMKWTRVPKWGNNGRRKVFHAFDPIRAEQSRGVSIYATVLRAVKMLDKVSDATLQAALLQTVFAAVVKSGANWEQIMEVIGADGKHPDAVKTMQSFMKARGDYYSRNRVDVKGAKTVHLLPDETLELTTAKASNPEIGAFIDAMSREVARGQGLTLEQYSGDYTKTNYSSSRMANIVSNKAHAGRRTRVMAPFCKWVLGLFLDEYFIRHPEHQPNGTSFRTHRTAYARCEWVAPPMIDADPEKTAKAAEKRLSGQYTTLEYECSLLGLNWEDVLAQRARELRRKQELGLFELESLNAAATQPPVPEPDEPADRDSSDE